MRLTVSADDVHVPVVGPAGDLFHVERGLDELVVAEQDDGVAALRERAYGPVPAGQLVVLEVRAVVGQKRSVAQERYAPRPGRQCPGGPQLPVRRVGQTQRRGHHVQPQLAAVSVAGAAVGHGLGGHDVAPPPPPRTENLTYPMRTERGRTAVRRGR